MVLNILLLFLVFGAKKKKASPYIAAVALGLIKFAVYAAFSQSILGPLILGTIYAGLAAAFVYFLIRLDRREDSERPDVPAYTLASSDRMKFRWEYIPLVVLLLLIIGGEILLK